MSKTHSTRRQPRRPPRTRRLTLEWLEQRQLLAIMLDNVPSSEYEAYAQDPMFQAVGVVCWDLPDRTHHGTATVIGDGQWLLTAAHLFDGTDGHGADISNVKFALGASALNPTEEVGIDYWVINPGYTGANATGVDLALAHLTRPILDVTPAVLFNGTDERGTPMYMAGYGTPGTASGGLETWDGTKRGGENIAEGFGGDVPYVRVGSQYWTASFDPMYDDNLLPFEWQSSPGDSGCPWFASIDGQSQLVAVNGGYLGSYGDGGSYALRESLYHDWIVDTMTSFEGDFGVTIAHAATQPTVTNLPPLYSVTFASPVTDFETGDAVASGAPGDLTATVTPVGTDGTTFEVTVTGMTGDGQVTVTVPAGVAHDADGNANLQGVSDVVTFDITPPTSTFAALITNDPTPTLGGTASDANGITSISVLVGGQTLTGTRGEGDAWTVEVPAELPDGTYDVAITTVDGAGNFATNTVTGSLVVDTHAPAVTVTSLTTADTTPTLEGTVEDALPGSGIETVSVAVGGQVYEAVVTDGAWRVDVTTPLAAGTYDVVATATDKAGNAGSDATTNELVVGQSPEATITPLVTRNRKPTISGTVVPHGSEVVSLNVTIGTTTFAAKLGANNTWTATVPAALADGVYNATLQPTDAAGNTGTSVAEAVLTVDTRAPAATVDRLFTGDTTPTLTGTVTDPAPGGGIRQVRVRVANQVVIATVDGNTWSATVPKALRPGIYSVQVTTIDMAGNVRTTNVRSILVVDIRKPVVTVNKLVTRTATPTLMGTVFDWSPTSGIKSVIVEFGGQSIPAVVNGRVWRATVTSPLTDGTYDVTVTATDRAGNVGKATRQGGLVVDTKAPAAEMPELVTKSHKPTLTGSVSDPQPGAGVAYVSVSINGLGVTAKLDASRTTWTVTWPRALADGVYNVGLLARDNAGNVGRSVITAGLTIDAVIPAVTITTKQVSPTNETIVGTVSDSAPSSGVSRVLVFVKGRALDATVDGNTWNVVLNPALSSGLYAVVSVGLDYAGNASSRVGVLRVGVGGANSGVSAESLSLLSDAVDRVLARSVDLAQHVLPKLTSLGCVNDVALALLGY